MSAPTVLALGGLTCRIVGPPQGARLGVVLCHGFGAAGDDLVAFAAELIRRRPALEGRVLFVFPEAPLPLEGLLGGGRAWWMLDPERLMALQLGRRPDLARMRGDSPEGLPSARQRLRSLLGALARDHGLPLGRLVLGGFSQGAMLATDVALRGDETPAGLVVLSGSLIAEEAWTRAAPARKGMTVLQSHGHEDRLLPYENAVALRDLLVGAGCHLEFLGFEGEHEVPLEILERLAALLSAKLPG